MQYSYQELLVECNIDADLEYVFTLIRHIKKNFNFTADCCLMNVCNRELNHLIMNYRFENIAPSIVLISGGSNSFII